MVKTVQDRATCTPELLAQIKALGFGLNEGCTTSLERILLSKGFRLPIYIEDWGYHFMVNYKYMRFYLNYVDALAEEILLLNQLELL